MKEREKGGSDFNQASEQVDGKTKVLPLYIVGILTSANIHTPCGEVNITVFGLRIHTCPVAENIKPKQQK